MLQVIPFSHTLLNEIILSGDVVIDATCGNGNDTLMLANACGKNGHVYAFDIQEKAIKTTEAMLKKEKIEHATCVQDSHEHVDKYIPVEQKGNVAAAIFNLGYLPRSDKTIITKPASTITALKKIITYLKKGGRIVLVIYYGHSGGLIEKNDVLSFVRELDQVYYEVVQYSFLNQKNSPPFVVGIEKR